MAVPAKFVREQHEALLAQEKTSPRCLLDLKTHFKKTIDNLRSTFTPKSNETSNAPLPLSTFGQLPQTAGFQGGHKFAAMSASSSDLSNDTVSKSNTKSGSSDGGPNLSVSNLPFQYADSRNIATPWDSGVELITPATSHAVAVAPVNDGCSKPLLTRTARCVSRGSIHYHDGEYVRFGSINTGTVTLHRAPSVRSQSAISFCNSELDDVESLAESFPEIGEFVERSNTPNEPLIQQAHR